MSNSIDQLIISNPYEEPKKYWSYNRETKSFELISGRRKSGYWKKSEQKLDEYCKEMGFQIKEKKPVKSSTFAIVHDDVHNQDDMAEEEYDEEEDINDDIKEML